MEYEPVCTDNIWHDSGNVRYNQQGPVTAARPGHDWTRSNMIRRFLRACSGT